MDDSNSAETIPGAHRVGAHDHAWRRVRRTEVDEQFVLGAYVCDLCQATWSL